MNDLSKILAAVWRHSLSDPGYYLMDMGEIDSKTLRQKMVEIKQGLSLFGFRSMARFDQQNTTRFHQDGGPDFNILMLGYEPSKVKSKLYIADHACAANDLNIRPSQLVIEAMIGKDGRLNNYISELPAFEENHSYILLVNNSKELGVLHKAVIESNPAESRIINSVMLI